MLAERLSLRFWLRMNEVGHSPAATLSLNNSIGLQQQMELPKVI
jgi:hypothetical protein